MTYTVDQTYHSPNHSPRSGPVACIVVHATAGSLSSSINWLCSPASKVSTHYIVSKAGTIYQLVPDALEAWHAGKSAWPGVETVQGSVNDRSLGIELENANDGKDPYPQAQFDAAVWLTRLLLAEYHIPNANLCRHSDCALPKGRKNDPLAFQWPAFQAAVFATATGAYTEDSPIMATTPVVSLDRVAKLFDPTANPQYDELSIRFILAEYIRQCPKVGVDTYVAIAQMAHETGYLKSWWSARPRRNPAGIGCTNKTSPTDPGPPGAWAEHDGVWQQGLSFTNWATGSVPAQLGRLMAYAVQTPTAAQAKYITANTIRRPLPHAAYGSAPTLIQLGKVHNASGHGWADPGADYGSRIAAIANRLIGGQG